MDQADRSTVRRHPPLPLLLALVVGCGAAGEDGGGVPQERAAAARIGAAPGSGTAWVIFGSDTVRVEVARTAEERAQGLMYREEVPGGTGMLFVFPESQVRSFWMQNTLVPLDIAFMGPDFRVVDIQQMEPMSTEFTQSRGPAMFALEVPQGWFTEHGIEVGSLLEVVFGL